jgi:prefoldin subunit 5
MTDLLTIAEARIAEKQVAEIEAVKKRLDADREVLMQAIELVNSHTLYKKVSDGWGRYRYVLATEEMLKNDYLKEPDKSYCRKGIHFHEDAFKDSRHKSIIEVNGENYYDIRWALNEYEKAVEKKERSLSYLNKEIADLKKELEQMKQNFPTLKQAVEEWMKYEEEER